MIIFYDEAKFEELPFYSVGSTDLRKVVNRSQDKDYLWNLIEKGFFAYLERNVVNETLTDSEMEMSAYSMSQLDTYMSYSAKKHIESNGYIFVDGRFVYKR